MSAESVESFSSSQAVSAGSSSSHRESSSPTKWKNPKRRYPQLRLLIGIYNFLSLVGVALGVLAILGGTVFALMHQDEGASLTFFFVGLVLLLQAIVTGAIAQFAQVIIDIEQNTRPRE